MDELLGNESDGAIADMGEKMLPVSKVNELIGRAKAKGRESAMGEMELLRQQQQPQQSNGMGGMQGVSQEQIEALIKQQFEAQQQQQMQSQMQQEAQQIAGQYNQRMSSRDGVPEDFDEVMKDFDPGMYPQIVYLATNTENTPHVMYDLAKNPNKLAAIDYMLSKGDAKGAQAAMMRLARSINDNATAQKDAVDAPNPLSRVSPSLVGTDSGKKTIRDLRKSSFLRG